MSLAQTNPTSKVVVIAVISFSRMLEAFQTNCEIIILGFTDSAATAASNQKKDSENDGDKFENWVFWIWKNHGFNW